MHLAVVGLSLKQQVVRPSLQEGKIVKDMMYRVPEVGGGRWQKAVRYWQPTAASRVFVFSLINAEIRGTILIYQSFIPSQSLPHSEFALLALNTKS